jgi:hypothetical protein
MLVLRPLIFLSTLLATTLVGSSISWQTDLTVAQKLAQEQNKIVFVAINMDNEAANDRMAKSMYTDKSIVKLSERTVNVIASRFEHGKGACKRFSGIACADHIQMDTQVRSGVIKATPDTNIVAPQHIFLSSSGEILLSVPYEVTVRQLQWCFVTAINKANPEAKLAMPTGAKAPRRLVMDGVMQGGSGDFTVAPLSRMEIISAIKYIRSGAKRDQRVDAIVSMIATDDPIAIDFLIVELGDVKLQRRPEQLERLLVAMGAVSPANYWTTIEKLLRSNTDSLRNMAAITMEQLAAPKSVKVLKSAYLKEEMRSIKKNMLRAMGVAGAEHSGTRSLLLKAVKNVDKESLLANNALLVLGLHATDKKALAALNDALIGENKTMLQAAALGLAFARVTEQISSVKAVIESETDAETKAVLERCLQVLEGGNLSLIAKDYARIGQDKIARPRFFGNAADE